MDLGYIGIGIMGEPMAANLMAAGHRLTVHNRSAGKCERLRRRGARVVATPAEAAVASEVVFLNVPDTPDVETVLFGPDGVASTARAGSVVIDNSTISPEASRRFAARLNEQGVAYLDAPVSGGDEGARQGTLSIMVGGEPAVFERCRGLLEVLGREVRWLGPVGSGQTCKAINQLFCALHMVACGEALALARRSGLDPTEVVGIISAGAGGSWALEHLGPKILAGDMAPGFMIDLLRKDLRYTLELGQRLGQPLLGTSLAQQLFEAAGRQGLGRLGTQALSRVIDALGGDGS